MKFDLKEVCYSVKVHCNLIIMLMLGAKQKERYNEMSVIMK